MNEKVHIEKEAAVLQQRTRLQAIWLLLRACRVSSLLSIDRGLPFMGGVPAKAVHAGRNLWQPCF
jgi:hypothetical protein